MRYILDTTLIIDHANGYEPAVMLLHRLYEEGAELFTCDVVVCEALSGGTDEHRAVVGRLLGQLEYIERQGASVLAYS
jgi:predicted nucleic acid-binding protein